MSPGSVFVDLNFFPIYIIVILIGIIVSVVLAPFFGQNRKEKKWLYICLGVLCIAAVTAIICAILVLTGNPGFENTGIQIQWYAVCIITGFGGAIGVSAYLFKQKGLKPSLVFDFALFLIPLCILGARIYYIIFNPSSVRDFWSIFAIWEGGLAIYGGIIGGFIAIVIVCKYKKINILDIVDCVAVGLILGQAIGRWGNFFNQEAYGQRIEDASLQWFPFAVFIEKSGGWYHATFFYEFFFCMIGFVALFILAKKYNNKAKGVIVCGYLIFYGTVRVFIEGLRSDSLYLGSIRVSQLLSGILIALGVAGMIFQLIRYEKARKLQVDKELGLAAETAAGNVETEKSGNEQKTVKAEAVKKAEKVKKTEKIEKTENKNKRGGKNEEKN